MFFLHFRIFVPLRFKIHQRGLQWKQGVVGHIIFYVLLCNTTPIHCTPLRLHPPFDEYPSTHRFATETIQVCHRYHARCHVCIYVYIYIYIYTCVYLSLSLYIYIYTQIYIFLHFGYLSLSGEKAGQDSRVHASAAAHGWPGLRVSLLLLLLVVVGGYYYCCCCCCCCC